MPGLPDAIVPRVQQLLRLLASDQDGEVLAAARALGRTLNAEGKSFHDLAGAVGPDDGRAAFRDMPSDIWQPSHAPPPNLREPPTWAELRDFERRDWAAAFMRKLDCASADEGSERAALRYKLVNRHHEPVTKREVALFNRLIARAWRVGVRP